MYSNIDEHDKWVINFVIHFYFEDMCEKSI